MVKDLTMQATLHNLCEQYAGLRCLPRYSPLPGPSYGWFGWLSTLVALDLSTAECIALHYFAKRVCADSGLADIVMDAGDYARMHL